MRSVYFIFCLIFCISAQAQDIINLNYGSSIAIDEVDIEFVEVLEDSRCPANVKCIQAGKAVVLVHVYVYGRFLEERKLEFHPSGFHNLNVTTLYNFDGLRISGLNLMPYPVAQSKTPKEAYFFEIAVYY